MPSDDTSEDCVAHCCVIPALKIRKMLSFGEMFMFLSDTLSEGGDPLFTKPARKLMLDLVLFLQGIGPSSTGFMCSACCPLHFTPFFLL